METAKLIRLAGLGAILGGICLVLFPILHPNHDPAGFASPLWIPAHLMPHIAAITFLFALPAVYARQGDRNGLLGLAGYVLATIATAQLLMVAWVEFFMIPFMTLQMPELEQTPPPGIDVAALLMQASLTIGYGVLAIGIIRARVLPLGAGVLLLIGSPFFGIGDTLLRMLLAENAPDLFAFSMGLFAIGMGWVGLALWTGYGEKKAARATARGAAAAPQAVPGIAVPAKS